RHRVHGRPCRTECGPSRRRSCGTRTRRAGADRPTRGRAATAAAAIVAGRPAQPTRAAPSERRSHRGRLRSCEAEAARFVTGMAHVATEPALEGMVRIPGGAFAMGDNRFYPEERPVHQVTVDGFWMDEHPVTA